MCIFDHREPWDTTCSYWVSVHWVKWVVCVFSRFLGALGHGHWRPEGWSWCVQEFFGDIHYFIVQLKWAHHTDETIKQSGDKYCMLYCCNRFVSGPSPASPTWAGPGRAPRRHPLGGALRVRNKWFRSLGLRCPSFPPLDSPLIGGHSAEPAEDDRCFIWSGDQRPWLAISVAMFSDEAVELHDERPQWALEPESDEGEPFRWHAPSQRGCSCCEGAAPPTECPASGHRAFEPSQGDGRSGPRGTRRGHARGGKAPGDRRPAAEGAG